jgi:dimethylhistidine N-methyltransferase
MTAHCIAPLCDLHPPVDDIRADVIAGLSAEPRTLPPRLFYDAAGSALFEKICELPEYYLTRTELAILRRHLPEMAAAIGPDALVIELGSGAGVKTRRLLTALRRPAGYVPIEISRAALGDAVAGLGRDFPTLPIHPVCANYHQHLRLPAAAADAAGRRVVFFPGSTLGNLDPAECRRLFARLRELVGPGGAMLLGVDLVKPADLLVPAYADARGVTAAFNFNLLRRLNRELGADFDLPSWRHEARWNAPASRMESHLVSTRPQAVHVGGRRFGFTADQSIWTESSYKFTPQRVAELAGGAFNVRQQWTDDRGWFAVLWLEAAPDEG